MAGGQLDQFMRQFGQQGFGMDAGNQTDAQLLGRFVGANDEAAFEALVQRHGPMVLGVCRRVLRDANSAEDAFQATFLVLVRKAATIAKPQLLGNWLYGVAYRVAMKARANSARRSAHERQAASMPRSQSSADAGDRELRLVLDEEINHLPEKYRVPLVLCYLEGKTNQEAARQLGCPTGSMSWRLTRGREMLRKRLSRRKLAFVPVLFLAFLEQNTAAAAVPVGLSKVTVHAGLTYATEGAAAAGAISPVAAGLAHEVTKAMTLAKLKSAALVAALVGVFLLITVIPFAYTVGIFPSQGDRPPERVNLNSTDGSGLDCQKP
jgi:RNA polymerase sigma factor (sigma-70 family)